MERINHSGQYFPTKISSHETLAYEDKEIFRTLSAPIGIQWELTPFCNQECVHCYNYWRKDDNTASATINKPTPELFSSTVKEIIKNNIFHVTITGGEPLIVLENAKPYLEELKEKGIAIDLNSNLTLLNEDKVKILKDVGVSSILTSLMAANKSLNDNLAGKKGAFEEVTQGILLAKNEGFRVSVSMVITKRNKDQIYSTAKYAKDLGVSTFCVTKASPPINADSFSALSLNNEEYKQMLKETIRVRDELGLNIDTLVAPPLCILNTSELMSTFGHKSCSAGKTTCTIGSNGEIRPCSQSGRSYGLVEVGMKDAWLKMQPWRTTEFIPEDCNQCQLVDSCRGGCRIEAEVINGNLDTINPHATPQNNLQRRINKAMKATNIEEKYIFSPLLRFRKEKFGGIMYLSQSRWFAVNNDLYNFAKSNTNKAFTLDKMANKLSAKIENTSNTAELLLEKGIIQGRG